MGQFDFEAARQNPLAAFEDELESITDLTQMQAVYKGLHSKVSETLPKGPKRENLLKARELAKQRLSQLTQEDTLELNPLRAIGNAVYPGGKDALQLGLDQLPGRDPSDMGVRAQQLASPLLSSVPGSKSAIGRGVDKGVDVLGGIGLAALSASEGWRGKPLTALKLQELGIDREKLAEDRRKNDLQIQLEAAKTNRQERKDMLEHFKTTVPLVQQMLARGDTKGLAKLRETNVKLFQHKDAGPVFDMIVNQPSLFRAALHAAERGGLNEVFGVGPADEAVKGFIEYLQSDPAHPALLQLDYALRKGEKQADGSYVVKEKDLPPVVFTKEQIEEFRNHVAAKNAKSSKTRLEADQAVSDTAIKAGQAKNVPLQRDKLKLDVDTAQRDLDQKDLKEYTTILDKAIKLAGGGGLSFGFGAGGDISSFSMGDTSKLDTKKLAAELRRQARVAPISDKAKLALYNMANDMEEKSPEGTGASDLKSLLEEEKRKAGIGGKTK